MERDCFLRSHVRDAAVFIQLRQRSAEPHLVRPCSGDRRNVHLEERPPALLSLPLDLHSLRRRTEFHKASEDLNIQGTGTPGHPEYNPRSNTRGPPVFGDFKNVRLAIRYGPHPLNLTWSWSRVRFVPSTGQGNSRWY